MELETWQERPGGRIADHPRFAVRFYSGVEWGATASPAGA
jgi:hypothetical protein